MPKKVEPAEAELRRRDLASDPLEQFRSWFAEAGAGLDVPEAMALATATPGGAPSVRMVLLKGFDEHGFTFFSGYESRKGRELAANPHAALCFYWHGPGRQVRVDGPVVRVPAEESDAYFATRPLGARLSAAVSRQSEIVGGREELEAAVEELRARYGESGPPRPPRWGGFRLAPESYEFWQHREDRLHDRFRYCRAGDAWLIERLSP